MAWFTAGRTKCLLCGEVISEGQEVAFPSFVARGSPFSIFNDEVLHRKCFVKEPLAYDLREAVNKVVDRNHPQWGWFVDYLDEILGSTPKDNNE